MNLLPKKLLFKTSFLIIQYLIFVYVLLFGFDTQAQQETGSFDIESQTSDTIFSVPATTLNNIVVTGQISSQRISESVNTIILLSNTDIRRTNSNHLADLLSHQAIFDLDFDPILGTSLSIQGMDGNNVNILIDGVPVIGRKGSQIDLSQINLSNIDRVEILKGPASVSYGTNSTGGVINLISKDVLQNELTVDSYLESVGVGQLHVSIAKNINNNLFHLNMGRYYFSGFGDSNTRSQDWRFKDQYFGDLTWRGQWNSLKFFIKKSLFRELIIDFGDENFFPFLGTAIDHHYFSFRDKNFLKINYQKDGEYDWHNVFAYSTTKFINEQYDVDLLLNNSTQTTSEDYNTEDLFKSLYNRFEFNYLNWDKIKIQMGLDFTYDDVSGSRIQEKGSTIYDLSLFSQCNFQLHDNLQSQFGLRIPYHSIYSTPLIPSLNLKFDLNNKTQFRLAYSRGFRAPSVKELFLEFIDINHNIVGNLELDAETSHSFQSSIMHTIKQGYKKSVLFGIESFSNSLKNKISLIQIGNSDAYTYYNMSDARYYGINTSVISKFNIRSDIFSGLDIMWNIFTIKNSVFDYKQPKQNISVSYLYEYSKCDCGLNINWKWKSEYEFQRLDDLGELNTYNQEGYQIFNFNLFKKMPLIQSSFTIGIKNLFDITDINYAMQEGVHNSAINSISWGRTYFIQLNWQPF